MQNRTDTTTSVEQAVLEALGTPDIHRPGVLIYQRDCVEALAELPAGMVPLVVTSPPYNIGKEYEEPKDVQEYVEWCLTWINALHRVTSSDGAFWLNVGYLAVPGRARAVPIPYILWERVPYFLVQEIVWHYGAGVAARKSFSPRNEKFLWYVKDPDRYTFNLDDVRDPNVKYPHQKKNGKLKCNPLGKNPTDVWEFPKVTSGSNRSSAERSPHPAQFPVAVIDRIVRACSRPGELILDPFLGSGTTAEVALSTGRMVLGFELEPRYIDIAKRRVDAFLEWQRNSNAQKNLFVFEEQQELSALDAGR